MQAGGLGREVGWGEGERLSRRQVQARDQGLCLRVELRGISGGTIRERPDAIRRRFFWDVEMQNLGVPMELERLAQRPFKLFHAQTPCG